MAVRMLDLAARDECFVACPFLWTGIRVICRGLNLVSGFGLSRNGRRCTDHPRIERSLSQSIIDARRTRLRVYDKMENS